MAHKFGCAKINGKNVNCPWRLCCIVAIYLAYLLQVDTKRKFYSNKYDFNKTAISTWEFWILCNISWFCMAIKIEAQAPKEMLFWNGFSWHASKWHKKVADAYFLCANILHEISCQFAQMLIVVSNYIVCIQITMNLFCIDLIYFYMFCLPTI